MQGWPVGVHPAQALVMFQTPAVFFLVIPGRKEQKVWNLQNVFSLRTIKVCRFEIIDGVKYVYCIKHAYKFLLREQVGFSAVL